MTSAIDDRMSEWTLLEENLNYRFQDRHLLCEALTHRSFANEQSSDSLLPDNERLEFLGDAVLDLVVGNILHEDFPSCDEGEMTRIRSEVVAEPCLATLARDLDIGNALLLGRGEELSGGRSKSSLLADAFEALLGAVFKDGGLDAAITVIQPLFIPLLRQAEKQSGLDYKSRLQELVQGRYRILPRYQLVAASGPDHEKVYLVDVYVDAQACGRGEGRTKKSAEQSAALAALMELDPELSS